MGLRRAAGRWCLYNLAFGCGAVGDGFPVPTPFSPSLRPTRLNLVPVFVRLVKYLTSHRLFLSA